MNAQTDMAKVFEFFTNLCKGSQKSRSDELDMIEANGWWSKPINRRIIIWKKVISTGVSFLKYFKLLSGASGNLKSNPLNFKLWFPRFLLHQLEAKNIKFDKFRIDNRCEMIFVFYFRFLKLWWKTKTQNNLPYRKLYFVGRE